MQPCWTPPQVALGLSLSHGNDCGRRTFWKVLRNLTTNRRRILLPLHISMERDVDEDAASVASTASSSESGYAWDEQPERVVIVPDNPHGEVRTRTHRSSAGERIIIRTHEASKS